MTHGKSPAGCFFFVPQLYYPYPEQFAPDLFRDFRENGEGLETPTKHHECQGFNMEGNWLVVEPTQLRNMLVKMGIFPRVRGGNKKNLSCHHPGDLLLGPAQTKTIFQPIPTIKKSRYVRFFRMVKICNTTQGDMFLQKYSCKHGIGRYPMFRL